MTKVSAQKIGEQEFAEFCAPLVGMPVSHVWRGYGSAIFLEFGKLLASTTIRRDGSKGNPKGEMGLMIQWSWRIEGPRSIRCGSWSDETLWPKIFAELERARVTDVSLFGRLPEIAIALSNKLAVVSFSTTDGQPEWTLFDRRKGRWIRVRRGSLLIEKNAKKTT